MTKGALKDLSEIYERMRGDLQIDKNNLTDEMEQQTVIYHEVLEAHARAVSIRDEHKTAMEEQYAISATDIRKEYEKSGDRFTESQIKEAVATHKDYLDAAADYLEAKKVSDLLLTLVSAYEMRGKMLRELAQLFIAGYYSIVRVESGGSIVKEGLADLGKKAMQSARGAAERKTFKKR